MRLAAPRPSLLALAALVAASIGAATRPARADVIPPGIHTVTHELVFELAKDDPAAAKELAAFDFYLFPTSPARTATRIEIGQPVRFYRLMSPRVHAVPAGTTATALDREYFERKDVPRSESEFGLRGSAPDDDPTTGIRTVYRIVRVAGGKVEVKLVSEERFDREGRKIGSASGLPGGAKGAALGGIALVGTVGLLRGRRRRARA